MSGHSKWSTIKRKKGALDAKRGKVFTRIIKEITIAVKEGGSDSEANPRLRVAIQNAKGANMPKDNIERAIKKGSGEDGTIYSEVKYEGYAQGGVALIIECATDNMNRTVANVRAILNKGGGNLGTNGSVDYLFERKGVFTIKVDALDEDEFTLEAIDAGAEDVIKEDDVFLIYSNYEDFGHMQKKLEQLQVQLENAELQYIPLTTINCNEEVAEKAMKLIDKLEDDEDVQNVFHNMELTDELMQSIG